MSNSNNDLFVLKEDRVSALTHSLDPWREESLPRVWRFVVVGMWIVFAVSLITSLLIWMYPSANWFDLFYQIRMEPLD